MAPIIRFAGHASFVIEGPTAALLSDPWFEGTAFNDGWDLLVPADLPPADRSRITDIYISHEHPDHFSPATLGQFTGEGAPKVRIQSTRDGRVARFCRGRGFDVTEMPNHRWLTLRPGFDVLCGQHRHMDSWLLANVEGTTILNLNDCSITDRAQAFRVRSMTGPVDVLFTQFTYANWVGNPEDGRRRREYARELLGYVRTQIQVLQPRYVAPFASFIRFCHEENAYLNDEVPALRDVVDFIADQTDATPIALYPGDVWRPGDDHDNEPALARYEASACAQPPLRESPSRSIDELVELAQRQRDQLRARNRMGATRVLEASRFLPSVRVRLFDIDRTVEVRCGRELRLTDGPPHVEMSSDSLAFAYSNNFGAETLYVNGRYRVRAGPEKLFFRHFYPAILNNQGYPFPLGAGEFLFREKLAWRARAGRAALESRAGRPSDPKHSASQPELAHGQR
jgi:hypothetical protein